MPNQADEANKKALAKKQKQEAKVAEETAQTNPTIESMIF